MSAPATSVSVPARFCGPDGSANGGWMSGAVARLLDCGPGDAAEVRLHLPPPLDTPMAVRRDADEVAVLTADGARVATGRRILGVQLTGDDEPDPPDPVDLATADAAVVPWAAEDHPFPRCFVCGPSRPPGDGLRIFAGRVDGPADPPVFAAPWTPDTGLADPAGEIAAEIVWAALDCPGGQAVSVFGGDEGAVVLGTMQASWDELPRAGATYVVTSWPIAVDGRKHTSGALLATGDGRVIGRSRSVWLTVPGP
ncbi:MAG: hypothetical protein R2726_01700 [Acidimicrobiales bacterium]